MWLERFDVADGKRDDSKLSKARSFCLALQKAWKSHTIVMK